MQVVYHPEEVDELIEAANFYDGRVRGLGSDFVDEIDRTVSRIANTPDRFFIVRGNIRRCALRRFPYAIYYRESDESVRILVIKHHGRHPDLGLDRT